MPTAQRSLSKAVDPLEAAIEQIADGWTFLLTREAFFRVRRFDDFAIRLAIPRARLSERLQHLVEVGILERRKYQDRPARFEYRLTAKGLGTYPIALTLMAWGDRWRVDPGASPPLRLVHRPCNQTLRPRVACTACHRTLELPSIEWPSLPEARTEPSITRRWRRTACFGEVSQRQDSVARALEVIGDRWSMSLLHRLVRGTSRFADLQRELGAATNTLTERLRSLVREGVLVRGVGTGRGSTGYALTQAGLDFLPVLLAARAWGSTWLTPASESTPLFHLPCGTHTQGVCLCEACDRAVDPTQVLIVA